jgi:hypothetical protein
MSDKILTYLQGDSQGARRDLIAHCYYDAAQGDGGHHLKYVDQPQALRCHPEVTRSLKVSAAVCESRRPPFFLEKKHLFRHNFGCADFLAPHDYHPAPLSIRNHKRTDLAFGWNLTFEPTNLRIHAVSAAAGAGINAKLHHQITVLEKILSEMIGIPTLFVSAYGQIKKNEYPGHAIFTANG